MGLFSKLGNIYDEVDDKLTRAEKRAVKEVVKTARGPVDDWVAAAKFADRFAGMISSNAPNMKSAPSFVDQALEPSRAAKKNPTPWNIYAAAAQLAAVFPFGVKGANPKSYDVKGSHGGKITRTGEAIQRLGTGNEETWEWNPPEGFVRNPNARGSYARLSPYSDKTYIGMLSNKGNPPGLLWDLLAIGKNRWETEGIPMGASPANQHVAGFILGRNRKEPGSFTDGSVQSALTKLRKTFEQINNTKETGDPTNAWDLRSSLSAFDVDNGGVWSALKELERSTKGSDDPIILPPWMKKRGEEFNEVMDSIRRGRPPGEEASFPAPNNPSVRGVMGEGRPAGQRSAAHQRTLDIAARRRQEEERARSGGFTASQYEARSQHSRIEWEHMDPQEQQMATLRAASGLPARQREYDRLARDAARAWDLSGRGDLFADSSDESQRAIVADFASRNPNAVVTATVMDAIYPDEQLPPVPPRRAISRAERAQRLSESDPDYGNWSFSERAADVRRIIEDLRHEEDRARYERERSRRDPMAATSAESRRLQDRGLQLAREAHRDGEWDMLSMGERDQAVERMGMGLPARYRDWIVARDEARSLDPSLSAQTFDHLSDRQQMERTARFFRRRAEDERG